jgi:hypothetical protein
MKMDSHRVAGQLVYLPTSTRREAFTRLPVDKAPAQGAP